MMRSSHRRNRGAVLAIVILLVAGLLVAYLMLGLLPSARKLDVRGAHRAAFAALDEALVRFAQLNQRLPCPANGGSGTSTGGTEDPAGGATDCPTPVGPVPWTTLGLPVAAATDPYGRLYSYRVYDGANGFTRANGLNLSNCLDEDDAEVLPSTGTAGTCSATTHENTRSDFFCITTSAGACTAEKGLTVSDRGTSKTRIAYVLLSHGPTGYGAFLADATQTMTAPTAGGNEATNASDSGTFWIVDNNDTVAPTDVAHFDDVVSYRNVNDVVVAAKIGGRSWALSGRLDTANLDVNDDFVGNILAAASGTAGLTSGSAVTIWPEPSASRLICTAGTTPQGITSCAADFSGWAGTDRITTANGEYLRFEFRIPRRFLKVKLAEFRSTGTPNYERAQFTFYNGTTQVYDVVKSACENSPAATARFFIDPGAQFTKVEIRANDSSMSSAFSISSIAGCKLHDGVTTGTNTNAPHCALQESDGTNCS